MKVAKNLKKRKVSFGYWYLNNKRQIQGQSLKYWFDYNGDYGIYLGIYKNHINNGIHITIEDRKHEE